MLIEAAGWRLLTDPTFDPPGRRYSFGWGTASRKEAGPAVQPSALGPLDAVLLSHDHHADNLDEAGRAILPSSGQRWPWWCWVGVAGFGTCDPSLVSSGQPSDCVHPRPARPVRPSGST
ncbi:hypothetical protein GCM10023176_21020 [Micromonospora coerulea]|uniref:Metallo-beta-lactamase domain-containing protein n=1 Tax=Micromonospora coerulea TaxID=47856 RepID=A0ABP8SGJ4_9ACTN